MLKIEKINEDVKTGDSRRLCSKQGELSNISCDVIIVSLSKLKKLAMPMHRFFYGKELRIACWRKYYCPNDGITFAFPEIDKVCSHPENPYILHRKAAQSACKTLRRLKKVVSLYALERVRLLDFVFTFPEELSEALIQREDGIKLAWKLWRRFWKKFDEYMGYGAKSGCHVNLHIWSTKKPLKPHFHFHVLMLNYALAEDGTFRKGRQYFEKKKKKGKDEEEDELRELKRLWTRYLMRFARKLKVEVPLSVNPNDLDEEKLADVHFKYASWSQEGRISHRFMYTGRHPLEDYAEYSEKHLDCPDPPGWLVNYDNRARAYGWFRLIKQLLIRVLGEEGYEALMNDRRKLCPFCTTPLEEGEAFKFGELLLRGPPGGFVSAEWLRGKLKRVALTEGDYEFLAELEKYREGG